MWRLLHKRLVSVVQYQSVTLTTSPVVICGTSIHFLHKPLWACAVIPYSSFCLNASNQDPMVTALMLHVPATIRLPAAVLVEAMILAQPQTFHWSPFTQPLGMAAMLIAFIAFVVGGLLESPRHPSKAAHLPQLMMSFVCLSRTRFGHLWTRWSSHWRGMLNQLHLGCCPRAHSFHLDLLRPVSPSVISMCIWVWLCVCLRGCACVYEGALCIRVCLSMSTLGRHYSCPDSCCSCYDVGLWIGLPGSSWVFHRCVNPWVTPI